MPAKKSPTRPSAERKPSKGAATKTEAKREVPPESAEDFEHVLRRLISSRDRKAAGQ